MVFEMSDKIEKWGNERVVLESLGVITDPPVHEEL